MDGVTLGLLLASAALAIALLVVGRYALRLRERLKGRPLPDRSPIPLVPITALDPVFEPTELGPNRAAEIRFVGGAGAKASVSDTETWVLGALAKRARRIFEIGTSTGRTTYVLANNAPGDAVVDTLTLSPAEMDQYRLSETDPDAEKWRRIALNESVYTRFYYEDTPVGHKVRQHFGDSLAFDESGFARACDLVFVDGSHAYSYVRSDSEKALRMVSPGGVVLWHDYSPRCPGVWRALNELAGRVPLVHVRGTTLVAYRSPPAADR